jgi:Tfp pilus assembly protein PilX
MALTVLAVSTMRSATLELTMAGNARYRENAFQLAEAGLNQALSSWQQSLKATGVLPPQVVSICKNQPWGPPTIVSVGAGGKILKGVYQTRVCYLGDTGATLSGQAFRELHYQIDSRGLTDQRGAVAVHSLGFNALVRVP